MVIAELASFGGEAQVGDGGKLDVGDGEARRPFILRLVLQFECELFVLKVGELRFRGKVLVADASSLSAKLVK